MSSEASSEQSCVREGTGYDKVYSSGQNDPDASYLERVPFVNSLSEKEDEDSDVDRSESDTSRDSDSDENIESPIRFVISPNGLRILFFPSCGQSTILIRPFKENT